MKVFLKSIFLFVLLSIAFSNFTACTKTGTESNTAVEVAPAENGNVAANAKSGGYAPAPAAIMQTEIKDIDGNSFKIEDKKGKVVLINLWAIWCGPCVAEMPHLVELQNKYKDQGLEIIGLNAGDEDGNPESAENIKKFAEKMNINYQLAYADEALMGEFMRKSKMGGIPQTFLINRNGELTNIFTGGGQRIVNEIQESVDKVINQ